MAPQATAAITVQATAAELSYPEGVAVDSAGDLFIADGGNNVSAR